MTSPRRWPARFGSAMVGLGLVAAACSDDGGTLDGLERIGRDGDGGQVTDQHGGDGDDHDGDGHDGTSTTATPGGPFHPDGWDGVRNVARDVFDPVRAGEQPPDGFRQVLGRDDIAPVYVPDFLRADDVDWPDDELVIGVELNGEARAYPVGFLNRREIVVDMHRGIPTLVTW